MFGGVCQAGLQIADDRAEEARCEKPGPKGTGSILTDRWQPSQGGSGRRGHTAKLPADLLADSLRPIGVGQSSRGGGIRGGMWRLFSTPIVGAVGATIAPSACPSFAMFGIADYPSFVIAVVVFLMIPGPGNLALVTSTGKGGRRGGVAATLGVIAGDQVLMWLAVAGVAALLAAYPPALHGVQWLGAGYLAWLGARMLLARPGDAPVLQIRAGHYFRQAFAITLLNPKAIVFYMAFFPLFVDPARHAGLATFAVMAATIADCPPCELPTQSARAMPRASSNATAVRACRACTPSR